MIRKKSNPPHSANQFTRIFWNFALSRTRKVSIHSLNVVPFFHIFNAILIRFKLGKSLFPRLPKSAHHSRASNHNTTLSVWFCKIHIIFLFYFSFAGESLPLGRTSLRPTPSNGAQSPPRNAPHKSFSEFYKSLM